LLNADVVAMGRVAIEVTGGVKGAAAARKFRHIRLNACDVWVSADGRSSG
jgi:hypothetical protein